MYLVLCELPNPCGPIFCAKPLRDTLGPTTGWAEGKEGGSGGALGASGSGTGGSWCPGAEPWGKFSVLRPPPAAGKLLRAAGLGSAPGNARSRAGRIWVTCSLWPFSGGRAARGARRELGGSVRSPGLLLASFLPSFPLLELPGGSVVPERSRAQGSLAHPTPHGAAPPTAATTSTHGTRCAPTLSSFPQGSKRPPARCLPPASHLRQKPKPCPASGAGTGELPQPRAQRLHRGGAGQLPVEEEEEEEEEAGEPLGCAGWDRGGQEPSCGAAPDLSFLFSCRTSFRWSGHSRGTRPLSPWARKNVTPSPPHPKLTLTNSVIVLKPLN